MKSHNCSKIKSQIYVKESLKFMGINPYNKKKVKKPILVNKVVK